MAVVLTPAQVASAVRLGDAAEEQAQAARLLGVATAAIVRHLGDAYNTTPQVVVNEAAIRIVGYLFDAPQAAQGAGYADILRNSAALALLAPYRVHRAGTTRGAEAVAGGTPDDGVTPTPGGGVNTAAVLALIAAWARTNNADLIPAAKLRAPTTTGRGAVVSGTNAIVDTDSGSTLLAWSLNHLRRMVHRIVPTWARVGSTDRLPARVVTDAADGQALFVDSGQIVGRGDSIDFNTLIQSLVSNWAERGNTSQIPTDKLRHRPRSVHYAVGALPIPDGAVGLAGDLALGFVTQGGPVLAVFLYEKHASNGWESVTSFTTGEGTSDAVARAAAAAAQATADGASTDAAAAQADATAAGTAAAAAQSGVDVNTPRVDALAMGDVLTRALPDLGAGQRRNRAIYADVADVAADTPADALAYKKASHETRVRIRMQNVSPESSGNFSAFGYSRVDNPNSWRVGGSIYPSEPSGMAAVVRRFNSALGLWRWFLLALNPATFDNDLTVFMVIRDMDTGAVRGTPIQLVKGATYFESADVSTADESARSGGLNSHQVAYFEFRPTANGAPYALLDSTHVGRILDDEDEHRITGDVHEEIETLRAAIKPFARRDLDQDPASRDLGEFVADAIDQIPLDSEQTFEITARVRKDADGTLAYFSPSWRVPVSAPPSIVRLHVAFDPDTYLFLSETDGYGLGGRSELTALYPTGHSQASMSAQFKTAIVSPDPNESPAAEERTLLEHSARDLRSTSNPVDAIPENNSYQIELEASAIRLRLAGRELANVADRNSWTMRLTLVG